MSASESDPPQLDDHPTSDRRGFLKGAACVALGACAIGVPLVAGVRVLVAPMRARNGDGYNVKLTTLSALPAGGAPLLFEVQVERTDAWTRHPLTAIGAVFLQRIGEREVRAFNASCPHLGCAVEWRTESKTFFCPCHTSSFASDGTIIPPSPAARRLDDLNVEVRENGDVWVRFQSFKAGTKEKIVVA
jgi:Rieske Fe-S protein